MRKLLGYLLIAMVLVGCAAITPTAQSQAPSGDGLEAHLDYFCHGGGEPRAAWYISNKGNETVHFEVLYLGEQIAAGELAPGEEVDGNSEEFTGSGVINVTSNHGKNEVNDLEFDVSDADPCN